MAPDRVGTVLRGFGRGRVTASSGWWALLALIQACAFPLFNVEQRDAPETLAYRDARATSHSSTRVTPPRRTRPTTDREDESSREDTTHERVRAAAGRNLGPRERSVLDPAPRSVPPAPSGSCYAELDRQGIRYERVKEAAPGVKYPVRLRGPVRGVIFEPADHDRTHEILDCRLVLALIGWAPDLRRARVRRVLHYSVYRPGARVGGDGAISGHAHGMAMDAARFELDSGEVLEVLSDWEGRERGKSPCPVRRHEASASRLLRGVTCKAIDRKLFQVVLTPHYDRAHANHVHVEIKPTVDWIYVR